MSESHKQRHKHAWSPVYGWQILRRSPGYISCFHKYQSQCRKSQDRLGLNLIKATSKESDKTTLAEHLASLGSLSSKRLPTYKLLRSNLINSAAKISKYQQNKEHFQEYFDRYGDVLMFPIHPDIEFPDTKTLLALWTLKPLSWSEDFFSEESPVLQPDFTRIVCTVNTNFPKSAIMNDLARQVDLLKLKKVSRLNYKPRWDVREFSDYLKVYDMRTDFADLSGAPSFYEISIKLAPGRIYEKSNPTNRRAMIDWSHSRYRYFTKVLMPFFDRQY